MERWQCQHVAKAIVDNAINKTLEEMGLSPNPDSGQYQRQRTRIEDAGVSHAIRQRGLQRYPPDRIQRLNPIISRLTQVSENLFSQNLRARQVPDASEDQTPAASLSDSDIDPVQTNSIDCNTRQSDEDDNSFTSQQIGHGSSDVGAKRLGLATARDHTENLCTTSSTVNPVATNSTTMKTCPLRKDLGRVADISQTGDRKIMKIQPAVDAQILHGDPADKPMWSGAGSAETNGPDTLGSTADSNNDSTASDDIVALETNTPTASFLLDQAVNAAIFEQGLHLK